MSNVAYADFGAKNRQERPTVASIEDGYARLSNMLLEEYAGADLNKRHFKVLLAVLRLTYGWNKKMDRISDSQIAEIAKLPVKRCNEAKLELVRMNILIQQGNRFGPNKNVDEWVIPQNRGKSLKTGDSESLNLGDSYPPKQGDTKDIIPNTIKNNNTPLTPHEGNDGEVAKPKKRKPTPKINYDDYLNAYNEEVGDRLPHAVEANTKRQRAFQKLIPKLLTPNVDGFRSYVRAFVGMARPFYFGDNDRGWTASIDYLLRETTLTGVREGNL
ncbi:replication protein [Xenorhabdus miraniensis]|uniref:DNA replication protein n=1 Tax=Xenorhabdus miraniensis TaxID=351674 RepID=A0A2D0JJZ3_9GAMM|nr:replication protein [Xenorhabdus miraniensis]PHM46571.1 DNA replication protein [Xenorhabdus miraniensis]